jgi:hypothetical protein
MMNAHGATAVCDFFFDPNNSQLIIDLNVFIDERRALILLVGFHLTHLRVLGCCDKSNFKNWAT